MRGLRQFCVGLSLALIAPAVLAGEVPRSTQPAVWVSRTLNFTYQGLTTHYSCDGFRDSALVLLRALGARIQRGDIREQCAAEGAFQISHFPGIRGTMAVLVPATDAQISAHDPGLVAAHWQTVNLSRLTPTDSRDGSQCELLQQARRVLLPLFATRNLVFSTNCVPNTAVLDNTRFTVDVLMVDSKPAVQ